MIYNGCPKCCITIVLHDGNVSPEEVKFSFEYLISSFQRRCKALSYKEVYILGSSSRKLHAAFIFLHFIF